MTQSTPEKPNVIWIFGDQHRAQATSHMQDPNVATPNIDRMAAEGITFTRAVAGCPWCTPFRASLLTGLHPHKSCFQTPQKLDESIPTIAAPLGRAGYETAWFGKWHLDGWPESEGRSALHIVPKSARGGFDTWIGYENNNSQYDCYVHGHTSDGTEVDLEKLAGYETDALSDLLIDFIQQRGGRSGAKPFFAALSVQPPHGPYVAPAEFMARHIPAQIDLRPNVPPIPRIEAQARRNLAGYYAMIENLDWNIGRIREAIAEAGLSDNTYILFFSDHGDMLGSHGNWGKSQPWEEAIRIPCILAGAVPYYQGRCARVDSVFSAVDFLPTTLGLCGVDVPGELPGFDYSPYRTGRKRLPLEGEPDSAYLQHVVRKHHTGGMDCTWRGLVTRDNWKYVVTENSPLGLYDLNEDPYELNNLAWDPAFKQRRSDLRDRLTDWIGETDDDYPLPPG
ncbi:MAG: sulfatase, partial [Phycisphaerae bacterium]